MGLNGITSQGTSKQSGLTGLLGGIGTVLGGPVGGLIGSLGSSLFSNRGAKRRQQLADQQNIKFWKMQNEYNLPANQMKRLRDAGLNPNLIYGSGSANTGIAGSVAPSKPAPYNIKNPTPSMLQTALIEAQINNVNSSTAKNNAEANNTSSLMPGRVAKLGFDATISKVKALNLPKSEKYRIEKLLQDSVTALWTKKEKINKTSFENKLRDLDINPNTQPMQMIIQSFVLLAERIREMFNPGDWFSLGGKGAEENYINTSTPYNR